MTSKLRFSVLKMLNIFIYICTEYIYIYIYICSHTLHHSMNPYGIIQMNTFIVTTLLWWHALNAVSQVCIVQTLIAGNQPQTDLQMIINGGMVLEPNNLHIKKPNSNKSVEPNNTLNNPPPHIHTLINTEWIKYEFQTCQQKKKQRYILFDLLFKYCIFKAVAILMKCSPQVPLMSL